MGGLQIHIEVMPALIQGNDMVQRRAERVRKLRIHHQRLAAQLALISIPLKNEVTVDILVLAIYLLRPTAVRDVADLLRIGHLPFPPISRVSLAVGDIVKSLALTAVIGKRVRVTARVESIERKPLATSGALTLAVYDWLLVDLQYRAAGIACEPPAAVVRPAHTSTLIAEVFAPIDVAGRSYILKGIVSGSSFSPPGIVRRAPPASQKGSFASVDTA